MFETLREKIVDILIKAEEPLSVSQIASLLGLSSREERTIYTALTHIAKSVRRKSKGKLQLVMIPPVCKKCGYVFKHLDKPRRPSKCPRCKSERIEEPKFKIIGENI
ncbi:MAG: transcriptional regulator [Thermoprotei archaeon]|nr:MAG: transcriptional regulator [Thermoprotei archaeon]